MKDFIEIKEESKQKLTSLTNICGLFWAFSNKQFEESKTKLKKGDKYVSLGNGGYLPKSNLEKFIIGQKDINIQESKAIEENKQKDVHILYELNNYECFYINDITEAVGILPYPVEDIQRVYNENKNI